MDKFRVDEKLQKGESTMTNDPTDYGHSTHKSICLSSEPKEWKFYPNHNIQTIPVNDDNGHILQK